MGDGKAYVKEHEQLSDAQRLALPDIKDVVDMFMAKDFGKLGWQW